MRRRPRLLVGLLAVLATGCQIRPAFTTGYTTTKGMAERPAARLAVTRFEDARPPREYHQQGRFFLTYVPLLPYVSVPFERLDESVSVLGEDVRQFDVREMPAAPPFDTYAYPISVPRAIAADLAASGLFSTVEYVGDGDVSGYDYVLRGQVRASPLRITATSYGLGMAGVLLWMLPLPMQKTSADLSVDLVLTQPATGQRIWSQSLNSEVSRVATMYNDVIVYGSGGAFSFNLLPLQATVTTVDRTSLFQWHFESLRRSMETAKPSMATALAGG